MKTKRYAYLPFERIRFHPDLDNHRHLRWAKVNHYEHDILANGLLEPLVVWEPEEDTFYLVGGFHRHAAIQAIRGRHPGYYERVDTRLVDGELDEIRALNLKLNADRLDARAVDCLDTLVYLRKAGWSRERMAGFFDRGLSWIDDLLRWGPGMDPRVRARLEEGRLAWSAARRITRELEALPPEEREAHLAGCLAGRPRRAAGGLTVKRAHRRARRHVQGTEDDAPVFTAGDVEALLRLLATRAPEPAEEARVREVFPFLFD